MSDKRISELVELTSLAADDELVVVDADANGTKRITATNLAKLPTTVEAPDATFTGDVTADNLVVGDGGTIGSESDSDAITIDASGNVALSQALQLGDSTALSNLGADIFRLTSQATSNGVLTALERPDNQSLSPVGSGMSVNSGVFTFPTTGVWLITAFVEVVNDSNDNVGVQIRNNADDEVYGLAIGGTAGADGRFNVSQSVFYVVSDVSTDKINFHVTSLSSPSLIEGDTTFNRTAFSFLRVGDL